MPFREMYRTLSRYWKPEKLLMYLRRTGAKPLGDDGLWELCKLGSNKHLPHKGAGSAVFEAAINWAIMHGAKKLFILSNSKLKAAVHIYEKYGFHEIKLEDYEYVRGDIAFEYMVPCGEASSYRMNCRQSSVLLRTSRRLLIRRRITGVVFTHIIGSPII